MLNNVVSEKPSVENLLEKVDQMNSKIETLTELIGLYKKELDATTSRLVHSETKLLAQHEETQELRRIIAELNKTICAILEAGSGNESIKFHNNRIRWTKSEISSSDIEKQNEDTEIKIQTSGLYFVTIQVLNREKDKVELVLFKNGSGIQYGYANNAGYNKATISIALKLVAGDILSVGFQNQNSELYGRHHTFSIFKIK